MDELRVYAPTAILGYGYPEASLEEARARSPHVIAVDAGSTDGGPYYLGIEPETIRATGQGSAMMEFVGRDVGPLLELACAAEIPLLVGSAGFAGGNLHLAGASIVFQKAAAARGLRFRMATIQAEVDRAHVKERLRAGQIEPLHVRRPAADARLRQGAGDAHGEDPRVRRHRGRAGQRQRRPAGHAAAGFLLARGALSRTPLHRQVGRRPQSLREVGSDAHLRAGGRDGSLLRALRAAGRAHREGAWQPFHCNAALSVEARGIEARRIPRRRHVSIS